MSIPCEISSLNEVTMEILDEVVGLPRREPCFRRWYRVI